MTARRTRPVRVMPAVRRAGAAKALEAAIAASRRRYGGTRCQTCSLPPDVLAVVERTLVQPAGERRVSLEQLSGELSKLGFSVGEASLQKHGSKHAHRS